MSDKPFGSDSAKSRWSGASRFAYFRSGKAARHRVVLPDWARAGYSHKGILPEETGQPVGDFALDHGHQDTRGMHKLQVLLSICAVLDYSTASLRSAVGGENVLSARLRACVDRAQARDSARPLVFRALPAPGKGSNGRACTVRWTRPPRLLRWVPYSSAGPGRMATRDRNPAIMNRFWNTVTPAPIRMASVSS